jgi:hypothetical protein
MKSQEVINKEIEALKEIKPRVREYNFFGDSNHEAIEAQIKVLEDLMSEDDIWDNWPENESTIRDAALEAWAWLNNESKYDNLVSGWEELT